MILFLERIDLMKTLLIAVGLTATLFEETAWAGQDAYQELRTRQVHEAKRAQAIEEAKLLACAEARRTSAPNEVMAILDEILIANVIRRTRKNQAVAPLS